MSGERVRSKDDNKLQLVVFPLQFVENNSGNSGLQEFQLDGGKHMSQNSL